MGVGANRILSPESPGVVTPKGASSWRYRSRGSIRLRAGAQLFMSSLWVEADAHYVPNVGHIRLRHYNASLPTGLPKSASSCKFSRVIPFTSSQRSYSRRWAGSMMMRPDSSRTSTCPLGSPAMLPCRGVGARFSNLRTALKSGRIPP